MAAKGTKLDVESTYKTSAKYSLAARWNEASKFMVGIENGSDLGIEIEKRGQSILIKAIKDGAFKDWNTKNPYKCVKAQDCIISVNGKAGTAGDMWEALKTEEGRVEVGIQRDAMSAPGPGKYGAPSVEEKYKKQPCFTFGGSMRVGQKDVNKDERRGRIPGPGSYKPFDPNGTNLSFGFGSAARIPVQKPQKGPDPGAYTQKKGTLIERQVSLAGKRTGKRSQSMPGPGAYMPAFDQCERNPGRVVMDTQEDRAKASAAGDAFRASLPGPGHYKPLKELGGNIVTHLSPSYSMGAKRKPVKGDAADVNFHVSHFTTFQ